MRVQRKESKDERRVLIGMIVDDLVLGRVVEHWRPRMFKSRWSNQVAQWCVDYYGKYERAPRQEIEACFESQVEQLEEKTAEIISRFLASLSAEYESLARESNSDYLTDLSSQYFRKVSLERLSESIKADLDAGNLEGAQARLDTYGHIQIGAAMGVDVLLDAAALQEVFEQEDEAIVNYPGDLGKFFGSALERDGFISFMGPEKRGKTFWLIDMAWRSMLQRRRTAFFEVGDMSQKQIMRRIVSRATRRPLKPCSIWVPTQIDFEEDDNKVRAVAQKKKREYVEGLQRKQVREAFEKIQLRAIKSRESYLRLACYPNSTINVQGIKSVLLTWEREGWVPDVIVIDYADILAPPANTRDLRDQINTTWKQLRSLSQQLHCLVVTATQSDAASYGAELLGRQHFSDDKRKFAHVTGMIGLNATNEEKNEGIMRLNWLTLRGADYNERRVVYVAGCLDITNPAIKSSFPKF